MTSCKTNTCYWEFSLNGELSAGAIPALERFFDGETLKTALSCAVVEGSPPEIRLKTPYQTENVYLNEGISIWNRNLPNIVVLEMMSRGYSRLSKDKINFAKLNQLLKEQDIKPLGDCDALTFIPVGKDRAEVQIICHNKSECSGDFPETCQTTVSPTVAWYDPNQLTENGTKTRKENPVWRHLNGISAYCGLPPPFEPQVSQKRNQRVITALNANPQAAYTDFLNSIRNKPDPWKPQPSLTGMPKALSLALAHPDVRVYLNDASLTANQSDLRENLREVYEDELAFLKNQITLDSLMYAVRILSLLTSHDPSLKAGSEKHAAESALRDFGKHWPKGEREFPVRLLDTAGGTAGNEVLSRENLIQTLKAVYIQATVMDEDTWHAETALLRGIHEPLPQRPASQEEEGGLLPAWAWIGLGVGVAALAGGITYAYSDDEGSNRGSANPLPQPPDFTRASGSKPAPGRGGGRGD